MDTTTITIAPTQPDASNIEMVIEGAIRAIRYGDLILFPAPEPEPPTLFVHSRPEHSDDEHS